ncbi:MAG: hypothetical protein Q9159_002063 [Coniocarpon cinnabarinum]
MSRFEDGDVQQSGAAKYRYLNAAMGHGQAMDVISRGNCASMPTPPPQPPSSRRQPNDLVDAGPLDALALRLTPVTAMSRDAGSCSTAIARFCTLDARAI